MLAKNLQAVAGNAGADKLFVEQVFQTHLYTGNGSTQTITNDIDLAGEGGLVFIKDRTSGGTAWSWVDTERGVYQTLESQNTGGQTSRTTGITAFNSSGFTIGSYFDMNTSAYNYASWTFRKAPKFFDVVTYTGNSSASRQIAHNLGSVPGVVIVKCTSAAESWYVYHRSLGGTKHLRLNSTDGENETDDAWANTNPTDSYFVVNSYNSTNGSGKTYVAYLFAHDAGGFGDSGEENVISCGSFTTDGSGNATVDLGWEPQWAIVKRTDSAGTWWIADTMRGWTSNTGDNFKYLQAQSSAAEGDAGGILPNATGFTVAGVNFSSSATYIYIAIRRGPMKTPESGTEVFAVDAAPGVAAKPSFVSGFPVDMGFQKESASSGDWWLSSRLAGASFLKTNATDAEASFSPVQFDVQNGFYSGTRTTDTYAWMFRRAPGFFDVVCYTASSSQLTLNHNLGVVPEMIITKARSNADDWYVWCQHNSSIATGACISLNSSASTASAGGGSLSSFTASSFNTFLPGINEWTVVAYLFASCPGVSKVGSYTGNGSTQTIDCGFSSGARFFLVKASSTTGDWHVFDTARGIVSGNDPYLELNTTNAEDTDEDAVDPTSSGIIVNETSASNINTNGVTYIYLAVS